MDGTKLPSPHSRTSTESTPLKSDSPRAAEIERRLSKNGSSQNGKTLRGIAIRQLSNNLTRLDSQMKMAEAAQATGSGANKFRNRRLNLSMSLIDCTSESFATAETKYGEEQKQLTPIQEAPTPKSIQGSDQGQNGFAEKPATTTATAATTIAPAASATSAKKGKRPNLQLQLSENDESKSAAPASIPVLAVPVESVQVAAASSSAKKSGRKPMNLTIVDSNASDEVGVDSVADAVDKQMFTPGAQQPTPASAQTPSHPTISPRGTFLLGDIRINREGIRPTSEQERSSKAGGGGGMEVAPVMRGMDFLEVRPLGSGASGVVMEAIHVPTLTIVALKMLPVYSQEKCENLSRELVILHKNLAALSIVDNSLEEGSHSNGSAVRCPNLLSLFNAFVNVKNGMVCLVMEYMDGGSLDDLVKNGGCNDEDVISDIARQTLSGLAFLHRNKSVHRDIKPANILCSSSGIVKIADFGISKVMDGSAGMAKTFVGTVIYMSPERITASSYGYPSDIWSLGLTLLAVANGSFPLRMGGEESEGNWGGSGGYWGMVEAVCDNEPPTTGPEFSFEFSEFIKSMLRKNPTERGTAEELLEHDFIRLNTSPLQAMELQVNTTTKPVVCSTPRNGNGSAGDDSEHGHLSASLETTMLRKVSNKRDSERSTATTPKTPVNKQLKTFEETPTTTTLTISDLEDAAEDPNDIVSIEAIRTKHLENIVTKMVFRDEVEDDHFGNKYGGKYVKGKLIRKESALEEDVNLQEIDDVDDLFGRKQSPMKLSKIGSDVAIRKFDRGYADLIGSILRLQGEEYESNIDASVGLTTKAPMPKLFGPDLQKWQNLARQLHLPLDHVIAVVESKLNETLELLRKENEEFKEEEEEDRNQSNALAKRHGSHDSADDEEDSSHAVRVGKLETTDILAPTLPRRLSTESAPAASFHDPGAADHSAAAADYAASEMSEGQERGFIAPDENLTTGLGDYGPCTSVVGVLSCLLDGLIGPFGLTSSPSNGKRL